MRYVVGAVCFSVVGAFASAQTVFNVNMDGAQADAGVGTGSIYTGSGTVTLNAAENQITVELTHTIPNVDVTAGHIHQAPPDMNGGIIFPFTSGDSPISQVFAISPAQVTVLKAEGYYVNIHTTAFPNGEIRGQILNPPVLAPMGVPVAAWWGLGILIAGLSFGGVFFIVRRRTT